MSDHTPAPWKVRQAVNSPSRIIYVGEDKDERKLATVHGFDEEGDPKMPDRVEADARLMAAAPKIVEKARELLRLLDRSDVGWCFSDESDALQTEIDVAIGPEGDR